MIETIRNAFRIKEVRRKILMTILFVVIYRFGCYLPVPGLTGVSFGESTGMDLTSLLNVITGSALEQGSIFAVGISPYINASIIVQLLTVAIPALERLSKEGEEGKKKINMVTRWVTFGLAIVSSLGIVLSLDKSYGLVNTAWLSGTASEFFAANKWIMYVYVTAVLVGGSMLCMWLGERITEYGVSNGISVIIFVGILSTAGNAIVSSLKSIFTAEEATVRSQNLWSLIIFLVTLVIIFIFIVWVDGAERKIKVQYAKQVKGNKMYGGQSTFIPIKVNASGVMPLIFAFAIMSFPSMLVQTFGWEGWLADFITSSTQSGTWQNIIYTVILTILIFAFAYFYSQIQFNPIEISKNIQNNGGFVTGIRAGRETSEYLSKIISRITLWGAVFLAIIALVPSLLNMIPQWLGLGTNTTLVSSFSSTGMLITVSVALEIFKALENQIMMRTIGKGFLK